MINDEALKILWQEPSLENLDKLMEIDFIDDEDYLEELP